MEHATWSGVASSALTIDVLGSADRPRVLITGDVDALTAPDVTAALVEVLKHRPEAVCVDLRATSFFGAAGLSALINARNSAGGQGTRWRVLVCDHSIVCRVFDVTGLSARLNVVLGPVF